MLFLTMISSLRTSKSTELTFHKFDGQHRLLPECDQVRKVTAKSLMLINNNAFSI